MAALYMDNQDELDSIDAESETSERMRQEDFDAEKIEIVDMPGAVSDNAERIKNQLQKLQNPDDPADEEMVREGLPINDNDYE